MSVRLHDVIISLELPPGVVASDALLGTSWPINTEVGDFTLHLPGASLLRGHDGEAQPELQQPDVNEQVQGAVHHLAEAEDDHGWRWSYWGGVTGWNTSDGRVLSATVSHAVVSCCGPTGDRSSKRDWFEGATHALNEWARRFTRWLEVLALKDHGDDRPPSVSVNNRLGLALFVNNEGTGGEWVSPIRGPTVVVRADHDPIAAEVWEDAVRRANRSALIPESHRYLSRAYVAMNRGDRRRAVIDAATGVEIALATDVRRLLTNSTTASVATLLKNQRGVVELFDLHAALSGAESVSRASVLDRIAGPRNLSVHEGHEPDAEMAKRCLALSTSLIEQVDPLRTSPPNATSHRPDTVGDVRGAGCASEEVSSSASDS